VRLRRALAAVALAALVTGGGLLLRHGYIEAKALLAHALIDRALEAHLRDGRPHRPWGWADTYPIGVLEVDRLGVRRDILAGASGSTLAFGVGHVDGSAPPNGRGRAVLAGHRDREFAFLRDLVPGDLLRLRTARRTRLFVVEEAAVVRRDDQGPLEPSDTDRLSLVTCYPFGGLTRSPLRYVVTAAAITNPSSGAPGDSSPQY